MKKIIVTSIFFVSQAVSANTESIYHSYSDVEIGMEMIDYQESLGDLAGITSLSQSVDVVNPTVRNLSYSPISNTWGMMLEAASTLSSTITDETWTTSKFGDIQRNDFKIRGSDIGFKAVYHYSPSSQLLIGARYHSLSFTRSNFSYAQPGADDFNSYLAGEYPDDDHVRFFLPGGPGIVHTFDSGVEKDFSRAVSVTEDQNDFLLVLGYRFDDNLTVEVDNLNWFVEAEMSVPVYSTTQNTTFQGEELTGSFNGYGLAAKAGIRYQIIKNTAITLSYHGQYKVRDEVEKIIGESRVRVPDVTYSNQAFTLGLRWTY